MASPEVNPSQMPGANPGLTEEQEREAQLEHITGPDVPAPTPQPAPAPADDSDTPVVPTPGVGVFPPASLPQ